MTDFSYQILFALGVPALTFLYLCVLSGLTFDPKGLCGFYRELPSLDEEANVSLVRFAWLPARVRTVKGSRYIWLSWFFVNARKDSSSWTLSREKWILYNFYRKSPLGIFGTVAAN